MGYAILRGHFGPGGTRRLAQGNTGKDNMKRSTGSASWQSVVQYAGKHLHEDPDDDCIDRGLETMGGHLTRMPRFVVASLKLERLDHKVLAGATSPGGKIALVAAFDDDRSGLVTWSREEGLREDVQGEPWYFDQDRTIEISFPHGSEEPAVVGSVPDECSCPVVRIAWGDWVLDLPHTNHPLKDACLTMWQEGDVCHIAFIRNRGLVHRFSRQTGVPGAVATDEVGSREGTDWIGLVDDSLATISERDGCQTFRCAQHANELPYGYRIDPASIGFENGHPRFVARNRDHVLFWNDGKVQQSLLHVEKLEFSVQYDHGRVFVVSARQTHGDLGPVRFDLREFRLGRLARVCECDDIRTMLDEQHVRAFAFDKAVAFANVSPDFERKNERVLVACADGSVFRPSTASVSAVARFHHGIGLLCVEKVRQSIVWMIPGERDHGWPAAFPLYNLPFDRLTAVEDSRGKAIMTWAFTDGTFHVIRYPLPK